MEPESAPPEISLPWEPRPLGGFALVGAYLLVIPLVLVIAGSIIGAVVMPMAFLSPVRGPNSMPEAEMVAIWLVDIAVAIGSCWAFNISNSTVSIRARCPTNMRWPRRLFRRKSWRRETR